MLKKIFVVLLICLMSTSCEFWSPKTVTLENAPFSYNVTISQNDDIYKYRLSYKDEVYDFLPIDNTIPIEFIYSNNNCVVKSGGKEYDFPLNPAMPPTIVADVLESSYDKEISADANGAFKLYGNVKSGEYSLTVSGDGNPMFLTIKCMNLKAEFALKGGTVWKTDSKLN